jgi:hypothetical protein
MSTAPAGAAPSKTAPTLVAGVAVAAPTGHVSAAHAETHHAKHSKHAKRRKHHAKHRKHHAHRKHYAKRSSRHFHTITTSDTTPPNTTLTSTPQNPATSTSASFSFTGTDNVGVTGYECSLDGVAYVSCTSPTSYSSLAAAQHTFSVRARDAAGNVDPTPATFTWTITGGTGITLSGEPMPVGDIPGWHQIFADDFQTNVPLGSFPSAVSSTWGAYSDGWHDTSGNGTYNCTKVCSVHDGVLDLYIHTENGVHYVAVPYPKIPGGSSQNGQLYGRYVVRFTADPLPAYKTAWLLWPDDEIWPLNGEIDFPEGRLDGTISAFMHHQGATSGSEQDAYSTQATYTSWHTAVIEWSPSAVNFILDGTLIGQSTKYIPDTPMHWVLQTETSTTPGVIPSDSTEGHVQVDWVAVYAPAL